MTTTLAIYLTLKMKFKMILNQLNQKKKRWIIDIYTRLTDSVQQKPILSSLEMKYFRYGLRWYFITNNLFHEYTCTNSGNLNYWYFPCFCGYIIWLFNVSSSNANYTFNTILQRPFEAIIFYIFAQFSQDNG